MPVAAVVALVLALVSVLLTLQWSPEPAPTRVAVGESTPRETDVRPPWTPTPPATPTTTATTRPAPSTTTAKPAPSTKPRPTPSASRRKPSPQAQVRPGAFDPANLFPTGPFRRVVSGAPVDPRSAAYVQRMSSENLVISMRQWTVPVYAAQASTPRSTVALTQTWGSGITELSGVPMPSGARPDPAGDGHLTVVQPSSGCVYDFYRARRAADGWAADWGNAIAMSSSGIYSDGGGTRAAGFSAALGLIWPQEIARGRIDHALVFAYPFTRTGDPVAPATRSDGRSGDPAALPIGSRVRLDPNLDLSRLGLNRAERVVAKALQEYGMVLGDTSGGFTLYAAQPSGLGADPYRSLFDTTSDWASLAKLPKDRFQVVDLPGESAGGSGTASACGTLE